MKHDKYDLAQMQSMPLTAKITMTQNRIRAWYNYWDGDVYVSRSGGKDSDVLGHIVRQMYPEVPQVFVNTGLEYDSVRNRATEECDIVLRPEKSFLQVITEYGYPVISKEVSLAVREVRNCKNMNGKNYKNRMDKFNGGKTDENGNRSPYNMEKYKYLLDAPFRISNKCCDVMKKSPAKKFEQQSERKPFIGTMACESRLRKTEWMKNGCNAFEKKRPTSQPLSFWTENDILQYIIENNIKIADCYGDIIYLDDDGMQYECGLFNSEMKLTTTKCKRTGCVFCMFGITQDTERFLKLKELEPQKYDYVMRGGKFDTEGMWIPDNGLGYKFVIDWLNENGNLGIKY